ncbi:ATP-binding cassette domain-containing protein, partial [Salmonella enterica]
MLKVRGLTKKYGDTEVVRGLDLTVRRGECFGLLGPNGAGKTTTLRLLLGLIEPDGGSIELAGIAV